MSHRALARLVHAAFPLARTLPLLGKPTATRGRTSPMTTVVHALPRALPRPSTGNHDTWPYFSDDGRMRRSLAQLWERGLSPRAAAAFARGGYYVERVVAARCGARRHPLRRRRPTPRNRPIPFVP